MSNISDTTRVFVGAKLPGEVMVSARCEARRRGIVITGVRNFAALAIFLSIVCLALPSFGGWLGGDDNDGPAVRERQIGLFNAAKMAEYRAACERRDNLEEDCRALERMVREEEEHYAALGLELEGKYGMTLSENYRYSEKDLTIYLVVTNGLFDSSPENPVMRAHRAFVSHEEAQGFVGIVEARKAALADAAKLRAFLHAKKIGLEKALGDLQSGFGVFAGKEYRLDQETGMFFEVHPLPSEAELKAMREAEERAVREAKERERMEAAARKEAERRMERERRIAKEKAEREAKAARERARAAAEAKAKAEREEKARAERERKAAQERAARAEAEAKAKAEKERKIAKEKAEREAKAERERVKAEKKAAEARARAEAEARAKAEKERKAAERKAAKEAEEREKKRLQEERRIEEQSKRERKMREEAMKNIHENRSFW